MKLSPAAEFAVRGVLAVAENQGQGAITLDEVCRQRDLPKQYLVKIFSSLSRAGLVDATRGKRGGYRLARDASEITILEVIEAVQGPIAMNFCQHDPPKCDEEECRLRSVWSDIQGYVRGRLAGITLAQCVNDPLEPNGQ